MTETKGIVEAAAAALAAGRPAVLIGLDGAADLVLAGEGASTAAVGFVVRYSSGLLTVALTPEACNRLELPLLPTSAPVPSAVGLCVSVDAVDGTTTGISAQDRARTVNVLSDPSAGPASLTRPGHVPTIRCAPGGVRERSGNAEAAVYLAAQSCRAPAAVISTLVSESHSQDLAEPGEARLFAARHDLPVVEVMDVVEHAGRRSPAVLEPGARVPTPFGVFRMRCLLAPGDAREHVALSFGDLNGGSPAPLFVHNECLMGDVFGSRACACADSLEKAMAEVAGIGRGVILYLRRPESATTSGPLQCAQGWSTDEQLVRTLLRPLGVEFHWADRGSVVVGLYENAADFRIPA